MGRAGKARPEKMHALHCILVKLENGHGLDTGELRRLARSLAMSRTEDYFPGVFDYRSEEDAGAWSEEYPGDGVVLGREEPDRFRELLLRFKDRPLQAAVENLRYVREEGIEPRVDEEFLRRLWNGECSFLASYTLIEALRLASGEYRFESHFFSCPDGEVRISEPVLRDALENPGSYALVFCDYHF